ncbi:MAG: hypothetical protein IRY99_15350, partial [Isosphaeraceae bacterium]|nr:hypothetical protein [Isosphaeraceae bacterium]
MTATEAQIAANRLNALRSCGPKTEEGKARSRRNAMKHGLAGEGVCLPPDLEAERQARLAAYQEDLRPANAIERALVERMATADVRLGRCVAIDEAELRRQAERAGRCWDEDRRAEVEVLAERLPKNPARVVAQLQQSAPGAAWLLERWQGLDRALEKNGGWDEAQRRLALDLLGVAKELRDLEPRVTPETPAEQLAALVQRQIRHLKRLKTHKLDDLDDLDRDLTTRCLSGEANLTIRRVRQYEAACDRSWR